MLFRSPEYHTIHLHIGDMYTHKGDLHAALQAYRDAIQGFGVRVPEACLRAANTLLALGEHTDAVTLLLPLLEELPNYTELHLSAGQALAGAGRSTEARMAFQRVLERCAQRKPTGWNDEEYAQFAATAQGCLASLDDNIVDVGNGNLLSSPKAFGGEV